MKKILLSIGTIVFAAAALAGGTGAFMGDTESSTGNTFATGVIDLKIDNESYVTNDDGKLVWSPTTSWTIAELTNQLFFNFLDIKPGDIGEDTISLHAGSNNAWACMSIKLAKTPENGQSEPEALVDSTRGENQGELQKELYFAFWGDDGDNVYEKGEKIFKKGSVKNIFNEKLWTLADSKGNIWSSNKDPIKGGSTRYIGKAWCFGDLSEDPVKQDGKGKDLSSPLGQSQNGPLVRGTGFGCSGKDSGNEFQTDGIVVDVNFYATQSRSNSSFQCEKERPKDDHYYHDYDYHKDRDYDKKYNW